MKPSQQWDVRLAILLGSMQCCTVSCDKGTLDAGWNRPRDDSNVLGLPSANPSPVDVRPTEMAPAEMPPAATPPVEPSPQGPDSADASVAPPDPPPSEPTQVPPIESAMPPDSGPPAPAPMTLDAGSESLDAGPAEPEPLLPVSPDSPLILSNDGPIDNWQGEYAVLLAQSGRPALVGIVIGTSSPWPELAENLDGWRSLIDSARNSGMTNLPDPIGSENPPLAKPADGNIASTVPNGSAGARFIVDKSLELARPDLPVVVATGGSLTDVADAYLLDPTVADRIVVVASLGTGFTETEQVAQMGVPNGELDTWADDIVARSFRYVQVSAYYDHLGDIPDERMTELPANAFGDWIRAKQPGIWANPITADQVSVIACALPEFVQSVERVSLLSSMDGMPTLGPDPSGNGWLVTSSDGAAAARRLWELLGDPVTFGQ